MSTIRVRTRPIDQTETYLASRVGGHLEPDWEIGTCRTVWSDDMTDQVSPGYFRSAREGLMLPVNPMTQSARTLTFLGATNCGWKRPASRFPSPAFNGSLAAMVVKQTPGMAWNTMPPLTPPNQAQMLQAALAKARMSGWDVGTFAAEFSKTASLVRNAGSTFEKRSRTIYQAVKSRSRYRRMDLLRAFSEQWLEYRYGWRTLLYDMQDAHGALSELNGKVCDRKRATEVEIAEKHLPPTSTNSSSFLTDSGSQGGDGGYNILTQDSQVLRARAGVGLEGIIADTPFMVNPAVTAWELVPYSFVLDWFFNVGDAVGAWAPFLRGKVAYGFFSIETVNTRVMTVTPISSRYATLTGDISPSSMVSTVTSKSRHPATPSFNLGFRLNLDKKKVTDIVALVLLGHARRIKGLAQRR